MIWLLIIGCKYFFDQSLIKQRLEQNQRTMRWHLQIFESSERCPLYLGGAVPHAVHGHSGSIVGVSHVDDGLPDGLYHLLFTVTSDTIENAVTPWNFWFGTFALQLSGPVQFEPVNPDLTPICGVRYSHQAISFFFFTNFRHEYITEYNSPLSLCQDSRRKSPGRLCGPENVWWLALWNKRRHVTSHLHIQVEALFTLSRIVNEFSFDENEKKNRILD